MPYVVARKACLEALVQELGQAYALTLSHSVGLEDRTNANPSKSAAAKARTKGRLEGHTEALVFMVRDRLDCSEEYARELIKTDKRKYRAAIAEDEQSMREGL